MTKQHAFHSGNTGGGAQSGSVDKGPVRLRQGMQLGLSCSSVSQCTALRKGSKKSCRTEARLSCPMFPTQA